MRPYDRERWYTLGVALCGVLAMLTTPLWEPGRRSVDYGVAFILAAVFGIVAAHMIRLLRG